MKKIFFLILFLSLIIYNLDLAYFYPIAQGDTTPARMIPFNILFGKGLYFDEYKAYLDQLGVRTYFFQRLGEHNIPVTPIITPAFLTPSYLPLVSYLQATNQISHDQLDFYSLLAEKLMASMMTSLTVLFFFLILKKISHNTKISLIFTFVFAFCTQTFSTSSQYLWQHTFANFFTVLSIFFLVYGFDEKENKQKIFLSLSLLMAIFAFWSRLTYLIFLILNLATIGFVFFRNIRLYLTIFIGGILILSLFNFLLYGTIAGGYYGNIFSFSLLNFSQGFLGLLFSPARGALFYMPILLFSLWSIPLLRSKIEDFRSRVIFKLSLVHLIISIFLLSTYEVWWGGHSWGNRLLADITVPAVTLSFFFYLHFKNFIIRRVFVIVAAYSLFIQILGVYFAPLSFWDEYPINVNRDTKRLWQFEDNPIFRSLATGSNLIGWQRAANALGFYKERIWQGGSCRLTKVREYQFLGYQILELNLKNESLNTWLNFSPDILDLKQIYLNRQGDMVTSPIRAQFSQAIIRPNEEVRVKMLLIPPQGMNLKLNIVVNPATIKCSFNYGHVAKL